MLEISTTQLNAIQTDKRLRLAERIDAWLLKEDAGWPAIAPAQRHDTLLDILTYADQSGMSSEREFAVFCRATIFLRGGWKPFIEAPPQRDLLLDTQATRNSKLRAYYNRCLAAARAKG